LAGHLGTQIADFYQQITALGAEVAAQLDFEADELPSRIRAEVRQRAVRIRDALTQLLQTSREGQLLRGGARVVIGGCPNAGKSSLLNALVGRDRAIVSPKAGTTRDTVEEGMVLHGIPLQIMDTAGLREATSAVEREGVVRAHQALQQADLILYLIDGSRSWSNQHPHLWLQALGTPVPPLLVIESKADLPPGRATLQDEGLRNELARWGTPLRISVRTGAGLAELRQAMAERLQLRPDEQPHATVAARHRQELECAYTALCAAEQQLAGEQTELVLAALELRRGAEALGRILGRTYSQDLLDQIFLHFCIGK
jgi:tRNA modification GTPase